MAAPLSGSSTRSRLSSWKRSLGMPLAVATLLGTAVAVAPAAGADSTVTVRGTTFPVPMATTLSFVGCSSIGAVGAETPQPFVGLGPDQPPAGQRSVGYDLAGGSAVGALHVVASVRSTSVAAVSVHAPAGARGVSYAGYQTRADRGTDRVWLGRADLVAAGGWQEHDAMRTAYTWTRVDLATGAVLGPGPARAMGVRRFAERSGSDGGAFFTVGFGCDGRPFSLDALRVGPAGNVTTYDLEGLATTTTIAGPAQSRPGAPVRLTGTLRDHTGAPLDWGSVILEERLPGGGWETVKVVEVGPGLDPAATVRPERTTTYRWRFVDRPLAEGSTSAPHTVTVARAGTPSPDPTPSDPATPEAPDGPDSPATPDSTDSPVPPSTPSSPSTPGGPQSPTSPVPPSAPASGQAGQSSPVAPPSSSPAAPSSPASPSSGGPAGAGTTSTSPSGSPGTPSDAAAPRTPSPSGS